MESEVVNHVLAGIIDRRVHLGHLFGKSRELFFGSSLGRETCKANIEDAPSLEHLVRCEPMKSSHQIQRFAIQCRRSIGNESAGAVPGLKDTQRCQEAQTGPQTGAANAQPFRKLTFGWQFVARAKVASPNQLLYLPHDLFGGEPRAGAL